MNTVSSQFQDGSAEGGHPSSILSPVSGEVIRIEHVGDPVFAQKMMGEGFGVQNPTSGDVVAPVSGLITVATSSKHALGIKTDDGLEVLLHLGIDTVELRGEPFEIDIVKGDRVEAGQRVGTMNLRAIEDAGKDPTAIIVVTNSADRLQTLIVQGGETAAGDVAATATVKG